MRIAVFGGSFNPIHTGHAMIAETVAQSGLVDMVWLMVSPENPLKAGLRMLPAGRRLAMARLAAEYCSGVEASDFEFHLPVPSFTYRTLCELRLRYPDDDFVLLIGSDNWLEFRKWKNPEDIIREFGVLIYERPGYGIDSGSLPENVKIVRDVPQMLISSTYVREQLSKNRNISFLVPDKVRDFLINMKNNNEI